MIWTDSSVQEKNFSFLDVSKIPSSSLHDLFPPSTAYVPSWELSNRYIQPSPSILESKKNPFHYNSYYQKVKPGSQKKCSGPIDLGLASDYCDALNDLKESTNIAFSKERLVENLTGGTCSAMAFQFADEYLKRKHLLSIGELIEEISAKYKCSAESFRTTQAAFNALHKDARHPSQDFMHDKIAAMLRFYDRYITDASEMFYIESCTPAEDEKAMETIESFLNEFQEGVFVVRCILLKDNDKGEAYGHSTLLIKTPEQQYFYDPDAGIFKLTEGVEIEAFYRLAKRMMMKSAVPFGRIYKIHEFTEAEGDRTL